MAVAVYDASVVIAMLRPEGAHHRAATEILVRHRHARGTEIVLPASAYAEALVHPERAGGDAPAVVHAFCRDHLRVSPLLPEMAEGAARLRAAHPSLRLPDALVLATAESLDAECVVTADARWSRYARNVVVLAAAGV